MEFDDEGGMKKRRQFVLKDVTNWHLVSAFGEEGAEALRNSHRRTQIMKKDGDANGSWNHDITQLECEGREEEEAIKVVDQTSAKRAIEILNASIAIQDLASCEEVKGVDIVHLTKEEADKTLERIIIRVKDNNGASVTGGEYTWDLTTPKSKLKRREKLGETPAQQLAKLEKRIEGIEEGDGSDNETMAKKMARKGKRVLRKDGTSLSQLEEELGLGFIELAVPRPFEKVKTNVFETAPPGWLLDDSQMGWSQVGKKGMME